MVTYLFMLAWVAAAVLLWRQAAVEAAPGWHRWLAIAVALPLVCYVVGRQLNKYVDRRR